MRETVDSTDCSRTFNILHNQDINEGVCWVCWKRSGRLNTGCNSYYKEKARKSWKYYRRFQYKTAE